MWGNCYAVCIGHSWCSDHPLLSNTCISTCTWVKDNFLNVTHTESHSSQQFLAHFIVGSISPRSFSFSLTSLASGNANGRVTAASINWWTFQQSFLSPTNVSKLGTSSPPCGKSVDHLLSPVICTRICTFSKELNCNVLMYLEDDQWQYCLASLLQQHRDCGCCQILALLLAYCRPYSP